jgi:F-type H+-transporting ATPase subunit epsilon
VADSVALEIVTPQCKVLSDEVDEVRIPAALGELGVLPGHTPLLTALGIGELALRKGNRERYFAVRSGFAEVMSDRVVVLAEVVEAPDEIDVEAAREGLGAAEERMKSAGADEIDELAAEVRMAETRIAVAAKG